jgi:hypothetical protein
MSPKANLTLRMVSVSVFIGIGAVAAVCGAILVLVSVCLIIGAQKVSDAFTVLSTLLPFPTNEHILGSHCEASRSRFDPGNRLP